MKKQNQKKLALSTQTIRDMQEGDLSVVAGGSVIYRKSNDSNCPPPKHSIE